MANMPQVKNSSKMLAIVERQLLDNLRKLGVLADRVAWPHIFEDRVCPR